MEELFGNKLPKEFQVILTKYGTEGSYNPPNRIFLNISNKSPQTLVLLHEITHLIIHKYIKKYQIQHWEKERIVDLILNSKNFQFLKYTLWQKDYRKTEEYIDPLFKKIFFKSPEDFFKKIAPARTKNKT